jgi:hypothetical protein
MWAIVDDGQSYFGQNPVALDFAPWAQFHFSSLFLKGITGAVRNTLVIQRATFSCEWLSLVAPKPTYGAIRTQAPPSGPPPTHWPAPASAPSPPAPAQSTREDTHHPKLRALIDPYLLRYNNVLNLLDILTSSGKRMTDLPTLPQYCLPTGHPFICWNSVLVKCYRAGLPEAI